MSTTTAIISLTVVGAILEVSGVIVIADRVGDLKRAIALTGRWLSERVRAGHARLQRLARWFRRTVLHRPSHINVKVNIAASAEASASAMRVMGGSVDERIQRLDGELQEVRAEVAGLRRAMPGMIRRHARDSALGVTLLLLGVGCLLAATILATVSS